MEFFLEHVRGQGIGKVEHFRDLEIIRVGRNTEGEFFLDDLGVSFDHAEIRLRAGNFWVVDRGSTNGTYVNNERAFNTKLREGDILRFGKKGPEFRYRLRKPAASGPIALEAAAVPPPAAAPLAGPSDPAAPLPPLPPVDSNAKRGSERRGIRRPTSSDIAVEAVHAPDSPQISSAPSKVNWPLLVTVAVALLGLAAFFAWQAQSVSTQLGAEQAASASLKVDLNASERQIQSLRDASAEQQQELTTLRARLESERSQHASAISQVKRLEERERRLEDELKARDKRIQQLIDEVQRAQERTPTVDSAGNALLERQRFQIIAKRFNDSVVLVYTQLLGKLPSGETVNLSCSGTGFIVTRQGHVVTNKHVIHPWKFSQLAAKIAKEKIEVDYSSHQISVWPAGRRFIDKSRSRLLYDTGFSTVTRNLSIHAVAEDQWVTMRAGEEGLPRELKVHSPSSNEDVAVLKIETGDELLPIVPYGRNDLPLNKLDPVMVLGFPLGVSIMESEIAETSPNLGTIRKVENSIWIAGSMHHGNSGGPVFNASGRVIGISTRIIGSENLGACIKIEHALKLLGGTW